MPPGRGPRCGRRTRTSSRSRPGLGPSPFARSSGARLAGHVVEVEVRVALAPADGRRGDARAAAPRPWRSPRPRRRRRAGGRSPTCRGDRDLRRPLAERQLERLGLGAVVERGRGAVRVHVVDRRPARARRRRSAELDRPRGVAPSGLGRGQVVGVGGRRVAEAARRGPRRPALGRALGVLEHEHAGALAHHEAVAAGVEGPRDAALRGRAHGGEGGRRDVGVSAASAPPVTTASASPRCDHPHRLADRVRAGRAGGHDAEATRRGGRGASRPPPAAALPIISGTASGETAFAPALAQHVLLLLERAEPADPGADHAADRARRRRAAPRAQPACVERLVGGDQRELGEAVRAPRLLAGTGSRSARSRRSGRRRRRSRTRRRSSARSASSRRRPSGVTAPTPGDDDSAGHARRCATTRSITSPTVLTSLTSSPSSSTPNSSSTICASSTRSSESTSRSSNGRLAGDLALGADLDEAVEDHALLDLLAWLHPWLSGIRSFRCWLLLSGAQAAVDGQRRSGHVGGVVGGEEARRRRRPPPASRAGGRGSRRRCRSSIPSVSSVSTRPGRDRVDGDPAARDLDRDRLREPDQARPSTAA